MLKMMIKSLFFDVVFLSTLVIRKSKVVKSNNFILDTYLGRR